MNASTSEPNAAHVDANEEEVRKSVVQLDEEEENDDITEDAVTVEDAADIAVEDVICGHRLPRGLHLNMARAKNVVFAATSPIPFHYVTLRNIKLFAFVLILVFIVYHGIQRSGKSSDTCRILLTEGRIQGGYLWQPNGCMMHFYDSKDVRQCMRHIQQWRMPNRLVFMGDSRLRYLYNATVERITGSPPVFPTGKHHDLTVDDAKLNISLQFYWLPLVNADMQSRVEMLLENQKRLPTVVLVSSGPWAMKMSNDSDETLKEYKRNLTDLAPSLDKLAQRTRVLWVQQDPVYEYLLSEDRKNIKSRDIGRYNWAAEEVFRDTNVSIWSSNNLVFWYTSDTFDGLHMGNDSLRLNSQILFNYLCNREVHHNDATCCAPRRQMTSMQVAALAVFGIFIVIASVLIARKYSALISRMVRTRLRKYQPVPTYVNGNAHHDKPLLTIQDAKLVKKVKTSWDVFYEVCVALAKLGLIMGYFVLCDRTDFFMKENKYYSNINFFVPLTYIFLVGFFFSEKSDQSALLHRDQTDEWKGWMQFVILVYHMTAGSTKLPIYMHVRVLVSSYLFLNGYAHFMYFWNKGDVSAYRFFQIVFRMNLLVFCLVIVMNRQYQFYYFVPLVTFWFLVTYATMALPPRLTEASAAANPRHYFYMVGKFTSVLVLITVLYLSPTIFDQLFLFKPWASLFSMDSSALDSPSREWRFRWKLDRYSVLQGMVFAFIVCIARKNNWINETMSENLFSLKKSLAAVGIGAAGLIGYFIFAMLCWKKEDCNHVHSYIAIFPILGYVLIRNCLGVVRKRFSILFAWAGRVSLELFIVQFHVWLAADTYGVLVFVPGYPMLNVVFTSFIYICVSHEVHVITGKLAEHLVPKDWKYLLLAVVLFCLLLTLLAFCYRL